jgi:hypothetical protein
MPKATLTRVIFCLKFGFPLSPAGICRTRRKVAGFLAIDLSTGPGDSLVLTNKRPNTDLEAEVAEGLRALDGWSVHRKSGGFHAEGPDVKLEVLPAGSRMDIQQVDLRLRRSVPKRTIELGSAKLFLDGKTAQIALCPRHSIRQLRCGAQKTLGGHSRVIHRGNRPGMGMTLPGVGPREEGQRASRAAIAMQERHKFCRVRDHC